MNFDKNDTDVLALELLQWNERSYRLLYHDIGTEWLVIHNKGWNMWGDSTWEAWWRSEWCKAVNHWISWIRIDESGRPYMQQDTSSGSKDCDEFLANRRRDKDFIIMVFANYINHMMLQCPANQAVMEISLHKSIKKANQNKS